MAVDGAGVQARAALRKAGEATLATVLQGEVDAVGIKADERRVVVAEGVARGLPRGADEECERQ